MSRVSDKALEPAKIQSTKIKVISIGRTTKKKINVSSIADAIQKIKQSNYSINKIELNGEIVYFSEKHGEIERWENEWKRQKRKMSLTESTRDCPFDVDACYKNDLCIDCKMKEAAGK